MRRLLQSTALSVLSAGLVTTGPLAAWADDLALIIGTEQYETLDRLPRGADVASAIDGIKALGFDVIALPNGGTQATTNALSDFVSAVPDAERIIVVLSGRFATDGARTWYLTAETQAPGILSLGPDAVPVDNILTVLARSQGKAILMLGVDDESDGAFDPWLREGLGALNIPQGVTVLTGAPRTVSDFLDSALGEPGGDLSALVIDNGRIKAQGFMPSRFNFMPRAAVSQDITDAPLTNTVDPAVEEALWQGTVALDRVDAYRNYLNRYPNGIYADAAKEAIAAIIAEPNREARLTEDALSLTRDMRRDIQRNLTLLDFNTRGIDGIFGSATRSAITNWQQQNGFAQTSYLTAEQVNRLDAQAARRSAQLEAEAARQQQIAAAADRAYWDETGARRDEAGLRAYLERYPDGLFATTATQELDRIEADRRARAQAADRAAWDTAREADTIRSYRNYLRDFPSGAFRTEATDRIETLTRQDDGAEARAAALAAENALGLSSSTIRAVEAKLSQLRLEPGAVDGNIDQDTRRALRNYQRDRGLTVTGYLNETTLVRLLADSLTLPGIVVQP